jgi:hypothetical protein
MSSAECARSRVGEVVSHAELTHTIDRGIEADRETVLLSELLRTFLLQDQRAEKRRRWAARSSKRLVSVHTCQWALRASERVSIRPL